MKYRLFMTLLCALLPITFAVPTPYQSDGFPEYDGQCLGERATQRAQRLPRPCNGVQTEKWKATLHRISVYASKILGEQGVKRTSEVLKTIVVTCEEQRPSLPLLRPHVGLKRDTNTNTNTNNVNVNNPPSDQAQGGDGGGLTTEAKIGIGVGVPAAVFALIGLFIMCYK